MDALLKLKDTKSTAKPGFTLLHFLVQHCLQHNPSALDVVSDLEPCGDAALFPYDFLAKDVVAIEASLHELQGAGAAVCRHQRDVAAEHVAPLWRRHPPRIEIRVLPGAS